MNNTAKLIAISEAVASARQRAHAIELAARSAALENEGEADLESIAHAAFELGEWLERISADIDAAKR